MRQFNWSVIGPATPFIDGTRLKVMLNKLVRKVQRIRLRPALFFHVQKNAGTSLVNVARNFYGRSVISHGDFWDRAPSTFREVRFVSGHFGFSYASSLKDGRFSFTILRDPIERIISFYSFCRQRDPNQFIVYKLAKELSFYEFLQAGLEDYWIKQAINNHQVWQFAHGYNKTDSRPIDSFGDDELFEAAIRNLSTLDYVAFTSSLENDAREIFKSLGVVPPPLIPKSNTTPNRISTSELTSREKSLLLRLTNVDRVFFEYSKKLHSVRECVD